MGDSKSGSFFKEAEEMMRSTGQSLSSKQGIAAGETIKKSLWDFKESEENNQIVISEDIVFKAVMTRDFNSIKAL